jgi:membrane-bound lytic murein transglycosylase B
MAIIRLTTGMKKWAVTCLTAILLLILLAPDGVCGAKSLFGNLPERLIADGVDANLVKSIYQDPRAQVELEVVAGNLVRSEATLDYGQFLSSYSVNKAARYLKRYRRTLERAKQRFGVEPEVVVAVLMVETALGTYSGRYLAVNVLSTMAASEEGEMREKVLASLSEEQRNMQAPEVISKRLTKRASRGYQELKALIAYFKNNDIDPFSVRGSSEGAIGIPQFLPSNIEYYGRDGDGDGRIDLFNHHDAIFSVAFFLRAHRWEKAQGNKGKKNVLLYYNRSTYYADTVYTLAQKLNGKKPL